MDAFFTTVVAGVVVAIVGAFAAYYFGGVRERQKQVHERHLEDQRRLEERERQLEEREEEEQERSREEQRELGERRTYAINEILTRMHVIVTNTRALGENAAELPEQEDYGFSAWTKFGGYSKIKKLKHGWQEILQQSDSVEQEMESLSRFYLTQESHLLSTTRNLFESFKRDFDKRYTPLSEHLADRRSLEDKIMHFTSPLALPWEKSIRDMQSKVRSMEEKRPELMKAAKYARDWDFQEYQIAFTQEVEKSQATGP